MSDIKITRVTPVSVHFDGRMYPLPQENLQWRLRYAQSSITQSDMFMAAGIMDAYEALVYEPERTRRKSIKAIREGVAQQPEEEPRNG